MSVDYEVAMFLCKWHADEFVSLWTSERKSLVEVKELLISHYSPKPILIYDRFKFHHRNQHESETVDQFVVELKRLMLKCELKLFEKKCCGTASFGDWKVCKFRRGCWQKETWLFIWRLVHLWVLLKSSLDWDCTLSSLMDKVDQGFKCSYCWRAHKSAWKSTRDQRCPSSPRWSIRSGLSISNCSQSSSTLQPILVSHYPCWKKFKSVWTIRHRKCNYLLWLLKELLGQNWLEKLNLDWPCSTIFKVTHVPALEDTLAKYEALFEKGYGHIKLYKASIQVREVAQPFFLKARPVPYALKEKVEQELQRLEDEGIIYKVSDLATPVVLVPKKDGSLRACGDYKMTVNHCADVDQYSLPNTEELFATVAGGQVFSKIHLSHAYQQVKYLTITTRKGLYHYKWLPFGVSSAPATFQRIMDQLLQWVKFLVCCLDDILISGVPLRNIWQSWRRFSGTYKDKASGWIVQKHFFPVGTQSFLDTALTKTALVPSVRIWIQSCKPRVLPMSQSWSPIWNFLRWLNTVLAVCEYMSFGKSWQEKGCSSQAETWQVKNILIKDFD